MTIVRQLIVVLMTNALLLLGACSGGGGGGGTPGGQEEPPPRGPASTTVVFGYDAEGARVLLKSGKDRTVYPSEFYNTDGTNKTKHIFVNGRAVATVESGPKGSKTFWNHADHLGSTRVVTNKKAQVAEALDYRPYGKAIPISSRGHREQRKFTGHEHDTPTGYTYAKARYLEGEWGRFLSQDPAFLACRPSRSDKTDDAYFDYLADPQALNCYAYARNNPLSFIDPDGQQFQLVAIPIMRVAIPIVVAGVAVVVSTAANLFRYDYPLRPMPFEKKRLVNVPDPPSLFPDGKPPKLPPERLLGPAIGVGIVELIAHIMGDLEKLRTFVENLKENMQANQHATTTPSVRAEPARPLGPPDYTTRLYTTPSGAVIDWWGNIIVSPPGK